MSIDVQVDALGLLSLTGVALTVDMNGSVEQALTEMRNNNVDVHYVEHLLKPVSIIILPGYPHSRTVEIIEDKVCFNCGGNSIFLKYLVTLCNQMNIDYKLVQ